MLSSESSFYDIPAVLVAYGEMAGTSVDVCVKYGTHLIW